MVVLGSGSSGNCTLVEGRRGRLLIDCGLSARETARRLQQVGCSPKSVDAVIVSHEHGDHVRGAARFSRRFGAAIHTTPATARAAGLDTLGVAALCLSEASALYSVGDLEVETFSLPHDAVDNVGVVVSCEGTRLGYATDLGYPTRLACERLRACEVLVTESNHDADLLRDGPYPWSVKQRIASRHGHLSNEAMGSLVAEVAGAATRHLVLAHLSDTNNTPGLARRAGRAALERAGRSGVAVHVAWQDRVSEVVET
ncbi:MAG: MBL fold metallo-hydrolase [Candidatus Polarisedimenticolia bacterium]